MTRPDAREQALLGLYEIDLGGRSSDVIDGLSRRAREIVEGVLAHKEDIDEALQATSQRWRVTRMPPIDRNLLRIGLYELRFRPATPVGVVIAEAVRLAKEYSTERSGAFVNGVLARLAKTERAA